MSQVTYYVVLPFVHTEDGLAAEAAVEAPSAAAAISRARLAATKNAGAVAFARKGDLALGEFADAVVLARFGEVPEDLSEY
jgi:hypothetical protein